jgi:hypothetical protein
MTEARAVTATFSLMPSTVTLTAPQSLASESPLGSGVFRVTRTGPTTSALTVAFTRGGTATPGWDYLPVPTSLTFGPGQSIRDLIVTPLNDTVIEAPETVILCLSPSPAYTVLPPSCATVTIASDEKPTVTLTAREPVARENPFHPGRFRLARTGASNAPLTVAYTVGGTATPGSDYQSLGTSLTFGIGQSIGDLVVSPLNDTLRETPERVILCLSPNPAYTVRPPRCATVIIQSDEHPRGPCPHGGCPGGQDGPAPRPLPAHAGGRE